MVGVLELMFVSCCAFAWGLDDIDFGNTSHVVALQMSKKSNGLPLYTIEDGSCRMASTATPNYYGGGFSCTVTGAGNDPTMCYDALEGKIPSWLACVESNVMTDGCTFYSVGGGYQRGYNPGQDNKPAGCETDPMPFQGIGANSVDVTYHGNGAWGRKAMILLPERPRFGTQAGKCRYDNPAFPNYYGGGFGCERTEAVDNPANCFNVFYSEIPSWLACVEYNAMTNWCTYYGTEWGYQDGFTTGVGNKPVGCNTEHYQAFQGQGANHYVVVNAGGITYHGDGAYGRTAMIVLPAECVIYGDPHVSTFDQKQVLALVQGAEQQDAVRDFWLVKSDNVLIQGRYENVDLLQSASYSKQNKFMTAIAVGGPFLGSQKLTIQPMNGLIMWNGEAILSSAPSTFQNEFVNIVYSNSVAHVHDKRKKVMGFDIKLPMDVKMVVNRFRTHLGIRIMMSKSAGGAHGVDGQCGNLNGDSTDDDNEMVSMRMGDTGVDESDSLLEGIL